MHQRFIQGKLRTPHNSNLALTFGGVNPFTLGKLYNASDAPGRIQIHEQELKNQSTWRISAHAAFNELQLQEAVKLVRCVGRSLLCQRENRAIFLFGGKEYIYFNCLTFHLIFNFGGPATKSSRTMVFHFFGNG